MVALEDCGRSGRVPELGAPELGGAGAGGDRDGVGVGTEGYGFGDRWRGMMETRATEEGDGQGKHVRG